MHRRAYLTLTVCVSALALLPALASAGQAREGELAPSLELPAVPWLDPLAQMPASTRAEEMWFVAPSRGAVQRKSDIFLDVYGAFAIGLGGWQDRAFTATDPDAGTYEGEQLSFLQGFVGNVSVGVRAAEGIAPLLRLSVGGGRHSYSQPGRGPEGDTGYDPESNRRVTAVFGRFSVGLGLHFEAHVSTTVSLFANVGVLFAFPFEESWRFRRSDPSGAQEFRTRYELGLGGFGDGGLLIWASPQFAFRLGVFLEGVSTSFERQRWESGSGAYADEPSGTIRFENGDFADEAEFDDDGTRRVHKSSPLGFEGAVGAWGFTLGLQVWF